MVSLFHFVQTTAQNLTNFVLNNPDCSAKRLVIEKRLFYTVFIVKMICREHLYPVEQVGMSYIRSGTLQTLDSGSERRECLIEAARCKRLIRDWKGG